MGAFTSWLEARHAKGTRVVMENAFIRNLRRSPSTDAVQKRIDAMTHALHVRRKLRGDKSPVDWVAVEVLPFCHLNDHEIGTLLGEYALLAELPEVADIQLIKAKLRRGMQEFFANKTAMNLKRHAYLFAMMDKVGETFAWAPFVDEALLGKIFDHGQAAISKLGLDKPH